MNFYDKILTNVNEKDPLQSEYEKLQNRSSRPEVFGKKDVLRNLQNSQENTSARITF